MENFRQPEQFQGAPESEPLDVGMAKFKKQFDALDQEEECLKFHGTAEDKILFKAKKQAFLDEVLDHGYGEVIGVVETKKKEPEVQEEELHV